MIFPPRRISLTIEIPGGKSRTTVLKDLFGHVLFTHVAQATMPIRTNDILDKFYMLRWTTSVILQRLTKTFSFKLVLRKSSTFSLDKSYFSINAFLQRYFFSLMGRWISNHTTLMNHMSGSRFQRV